MKRMWLAVGATAWLALYTVPAAAQARNQALVAEEPGRYSIALCPLRYAGKVNDAQKQFRTGIEDKDAAKRAQGLATAERMLLETIAAGESGNAAAWYLLARAYLAQGDVTGADSAFSKAEALQPDCEIDIGQYRQNAWATVANAGLDLQRQGDDEGALALFRDASRLYGGLPHVFENMGVMFANLGQSDSAAIYFGKALATAVDDTSLVANRNSAALNLALMQQRLGQHEEAAATLRQYLSWNPGETDARRSLAYSLRELGRTEDAEALENELVSEFSRMNLDSLGFQDLMAVAVSQFNGGRYDQAATVFQKLMDRNPWSRDAVYNLANTYLAMKDNRNLVDIGLRLVRIEPMNEDVYRLVGQGYRGLEKQDSLLIMAERLVTLPANVEVTGFAVGGAGARWTAVATGRAAMDATGKAIPPAPVTLTLEFVNEAGAVLATEQLSIPALPAGATHELRADGRVEGIAGWRYRRAQ